MCRPLWAGYVAGEQVFSKAGEGSHDALGRQFNVTEPSLHRLAQQWTSPSPLDVPASWQPFECRWTREREALWQPNTNRFYQLGDLPTGNDYILAGQRLSEDMGTPDKLRDWVLEAARLYGEVELRGVFDDDGALVAQSIFGREQRLFEAALSVLKHPNALYETVPVARLQVGDRTRYLVDPGKPRNARAVFEHWAETFSERKNRVELWAN